MYKRLIIMCIFIMSSVYSQEEQIIKNIEIEYNNIKERLDSLKMDKLTVFSLSLDGTEVITYRDKNNKIRLLTLWFDGEFGRNYEEYYFTNDSLIYSFIQFYDYDLLDDTTDTESKKYNSVSSKVSNEDKIYFKNNKLIRWFKNNEYNVNPKSREFYSLERSLLLNLQELLAEINEK